MSFLRIGPDRFVNVFYLKYIELYHDEGDYYQLTIANTEQSTDHDKIYEIHEYDECFNDIDKFYKSLGKE